MTALSGGSPTTTSGTTPLWITIEPHVMALFYKVGKHGRPAGLIEIGPILDDMPVGMQDPGTVQRLDALQGDVGHREPDRISEGVTDPT